MSPHPAVPQVCPAAIPPIPHWVAGEGAGIMWVGNCDRVSSSPGCHATELRCSSRQRHRFDTPVPQPRCPGPRVLQSCRVVGSRRLLRELTTSCRDSFAGLGV